VKTVATRTLALLKVSKAVYDEIRIALEAAGYGDEMWREYDGRPVIDMNGIGIMRNDDEARRLVPRAKVKIP
jgi:hypothetical protein